MRQFGSLLARGRICNAARASLAMAAPVDRVPATGGRAASTRRTSSRQLRGSRQADSRQGDCSPDRGPRHPGPRRCGPAVRRGPAATRVAVRALDSLEKPLDDLTAGVTTLGARMRSEPLEQLPGLRLVSLRRNWQFFDRQLGRWRRELQRELDRSTRTTRRSWPPVASSGRPPARRRSSRVAAGIGRRIDDVLKRIERADRALSVPLASPARTCQAGQRGEGHLSRRACEPSRPLRRATMSPLGIRRRHRCGTHGESGACPRRSFWRDQVAGIWTARSCASISRRAASSSGCTPSSPARTSGAPDWFRKRTQALIAHDPEMRSSTQARAAPPVFLAGAGADRDARVPVGLAHRAARGGAADGRHPGAAAVATGCLPGTRRLAVCRHGSLRVATAGVPVRRRRACVSRAPAGGDAAVAGRAAVDTARGETACAAESVTKLKKAARVAGWLGVFLLAVSVTANLLGNMSLAEVLTRGTLDSGYLGLVLYASATVLGSIARNFRVRRGAIPCMESRSGLRRCSKPWRDSSVMRRSSCGF